jgi:hypothetical protein
MSWPYLPWNPDERNLPYQRYDPDTGGTFYRFLDRNGVYTHVWAPRIEVWAAAIGKGMVAAQQAARPVGIMPDVSRIRHEKQPIPK